MFFKKNERGFALIIVLFAIIFIMTVSAVFMRGTISNAKQERIVDQNNLAVVAAEMGLDYYVTKIGNEEKVLNEKAIKKADSILKDYITCKSGPKPLICADPILNVKKVVDDYVKEMNEIVLALEKPPIFFIPEDRRFSYSLISSRLEVVGKEIIISLVNLGKADIERPAELYSNIKYTIPSFIVRNPDQGEGSSTQGSTDQIFNDMKKLLTNKSPNEVCSHKNGHCINGQFYSEGFANPNNPNNQGNGQLIWALNGILDPHNNINKFNFTLITRSIDYSKNMSKMNGQLILLGEDNQKGKIKSKFGIDSFETNNNKINNPKLCINVDGFSKSDIEKITYPDYSKVFFYSAKQVPSWPAGIKESQKRTGTLAGFVNECVGKTLIPEGNQPGDHKNEFLVVTKPVQLDVDVSYTGGIK